MWVGKGRAHQKYLVACNMQGANSRGRRYLFTSSSPPPSVVPGVFSGYFPPNAASVLAAPCPAPKMHVLIGEGGRYSIQTYGTRLGPGSFACRKDAQVVLCMGPLGPWIPDSVPCTLQCSPLVHLRQTSERLDGATTTANPLTIWQSGYLGLLGMLPAAAALCSLTAALGQSPHR